MCVKFILMANEQKDLSKAERIAREERELAIAEEEQDLQQNRRYQLHLRVCEHCGTYHPREHWYYYLEGKPSPYCHAYNLMIAGSRRIQCRVCADYYTLRHFCGVRGAGKNHEYQPHSETRKRS